jgi:DNA-binding MarR family transcriptional regulator
MVPEPAWLSHEQQDAWRILISVHARLLGRLDAELQAACGISLGEFEVLVLLSEAPEEALRMAELAERLVVSPSGLTRRVDKLVRDGLVGRRPCPSDRRGSFAALTPGGRDMLARAAPHHLVGVRRYVIEPLSSRQLVDLAAGMRSIGQALDAR